MQPCHVVEIITPKKFVLNGLWFGPKRPRRAIVFVHGLGGSVFSMQGTVNALADKRTAVLTFNNRGHDKVATLKNTKKARFKGGAAHEVFTDCVDDLQGALNFMRRRGVNNIFLAGHSTGCQKSIYWAYKKKGRGVEGIILLAPISDWSAEMHLKGKQKIARAARAARALVGRGKKHSLLPEGVWYEILDAQRFLSLYGPDSVEEIFSYSQPRKVPRILKSVGPPVLALWAAKDEFADKSPKEVATWFEAHLRKGRVVIVPKVGHGFKGGEKTVALEIKKFIRVQ
ncbi:MAG: alpha/beta fold hydrolase [Patescibacteria group bacterium]